MKKRNQLRDMQTGRAPSPVKATPAQGIKTSSNVPAAPKGGGAPAIGAKR